MGVCFSIKRNTNTNTKAINIFKKRSQTVFKVKQDEENKSNLSSKGTIEKEKPIDILKSVNSEFKNGINSDITNDKNDIINIEFISSDQKINYTIDCLKSQYFYEIEEKLYEKYPKYRESNNYFIVDGKEILRFKTIEQNGINKGMILILNKNDKNIVYTTDNSV